MKVQIYGGGCDKCKRLAANVEVAAQQLGISIDLEKVTDIEAITNAGILMTPAMAVNGKIVSTGKVLSPAEITAFLQPQPCTCGGACSGSHTASAPVEASATCSCGCNDAKETSSCSCGSNDKATSTCSCGCGGSKGKPKIGTILLLAIVMISLGVAIFREVKGTSASTTEETDTAVIGTVNPTQEPLLTVYYFHGNKRCPTCNKFEQLTREVVSSHFSDALAQGKVIVKIINVEAPGNAHYVQDFQLTTKSIVLQTKDTYKNLDQIWTRINASDADLITYLETEIKALLEPSK